MSRKPIRLLMIAFILTGGVVFMNPELRARLFLKWWPQLRQQASQASGKVFDSIEDIKFPEADWGGGKGRDKPRKIYKWKDSRGKWQYSTEPPPSGAKVEMMVLQPNQNVVAGKGSEAVAQTAQDGTPENNDKGKADKSGLNVLLEALDKPFEKTEQTRQQMERHNRELEHLSQ